MSDEPAAPADLALEGRIQHAIAPYQDRLTPEALAEARRLLTVLLTTHPALVPLMDRVRRGAAPKTSGVAVKDDARDDDGRAAAAPRGKGRR